MLCSNLIGASRMIRLESAVIYEKKHGIAFVTMDRPGVRNAINTEMLARLADAWQSVNADPSVHVAILRGAGDKAFCAGADLDRLVRMMKGLRSPETEFDQRVLNDYSIICAHHDRGLRAGRNAGEGRHVQRRGRSFEGGRGQ